MTEEHRGRKQEYVVAAGAEEVVARVKPALDAIGRMTFTVGTEPWHANAVKLCGNFMIASLLETFGEAAATLRKADVDPGLFLEIINTLFQSPVYGNYGGQIVEGRYEPAGFALKLGLKDVGLVLETARECAAPMPIASVVRDQFVAAMAAGQGDQDWSSVARVAARAAGLG